MKKPGLRSAKRLPESQRGGRKGRRQDSHSDLLPHLRAPPPVSPGGSDCNRSVPPGPHAANLSPPLAAQNIPLPNLQPEGRARFHLHLRTCRSAIRVCPRTATTLCARPLPCAPHTGSGTWGSAHRAAGGGDAGSKGPHGRSRAVRARRAHRGAGSPAPYRPPGTWPLRSPAPAAARSAGTPPTFSEGHRGEVLPGH